MAEQKSISVDTTETLTITSLDVDSSRVITASYYTPFSTVGVLNIDDLIDDRIRKERINCPNCGAPLRESKTYCEYCETRFD